tara:strand:- start:268 stop:1404 length:1137 start_codon:yes stop_codon:yes gene_type:complete
MKIVGLVGWRGMVGSVLIERMLDEKDFNDIEPFFFSTSNIGGAAPIFFEDEKKLKNAMDINQLKKCDIILSCQGGTYTSEIYPILRSSGWSGFWIDAASTLRMKEDSVIVLDPLNSSIIKSKISLGIKNFIGGNCTVSCMLMALAGLFEKKLIKWINFMTYQAASGGGAKHMKELITQFGILNREVSDNLKNPSSMILDLERKIHEKQRNLLKEEVECFQVPLAGNLIPWIDSDLGNGKSREEWKSSTEANKILEVFNTQKKTRQELIFFDGICVRVGSMRSHSMALLIKLNEDIPLDEIEDIIDSHNKWVKVIPNNYEESIKKLTPVAVSGCLDIPIGRLRKMDFGKKYLSAFTVGDQLLWGAAEPLRRMLRILIEI